jgi:DNA sulfur modification protein DndE
MIETVRLSEKARSQLITLKRRTGLENWNVLCRWAYCLSLAEPSRPPDETIPADSSVEMTWKTFTGGQDELYWGALVLRAERDGVPLKEESLAHYFRLHLHRGISYLNGHPNIKDIRGLLGLVLAHDVPKVAEAR